MAEKKPGNRIQMGTVCNAFVLPGWPWPQTDYMAGVLSSHADSWAW